jgi:parallel beta-helix repeat protein
MIKVLSIIFLLLMLCISQAHAGETWYVYGATVISGDGKSWDTAFKTIQEGINAAADGDTVVVAMGEYFMNVNMKGKNITLRGTDPESASMVEKTVINGMERGPAVTFAGTEDETCVLEGFTIRKGKVAIGAGILGGTANSRTHATIRNNVITENKAEQHGGGIAFCDGLILNNTISGNSAPTNGGGLYTCKGTIKGNLISENTAHLGAGLADCHGTIEFNLIRDNSATVGGTSSGGGIAESNALIWGNLIVRNSASYDGGGLHTCRGTIQNNTIGGNSAVHGGGGIAYSDTSGMRIQNNTIVGNAVPTGWGGGGFHFGYARVENCIIWGNTARLDPQLNAAYPTYCCIQDWTGGGEGNISDDPLFADADGPDDAPDTYEDNDYHLTDDSPCIDAGTNDDWMWHGRDQDENMRIAFGKDGVFVDMGVFEYNSFPFGADILIFPTREPVVFWRSRPGDVYTLWSCLDLVNTEWVVEEEEVFSQGLTTAWKDSNAPQRMKFYKVEMQ